MNYNTVRMPPSNCPHCGLNMDCASSTDGVHAKPEEGDLSVCIGCATPLTFDSNLMLKALTNEQINQLPVLSQIDLKRTVLAVKKLRGV